MEGAVGSMNAQYYSYKLGESLLSAVEDEMGDTWNLKSDNDLINTTAHTIESLEANHIHVYIGLFALQI